MIEQIIEQLTYLTHKQKEEPCFYLQFKEHMLQNELELYRQEYMRK